MRIFKFRHGSQKDFEALEQSYIWFSSLDRLNDPFEGCFYLDPEVSDEVLFKYHKNILAREPLSNISPADEVVKRFIDEEKKQVGGYKQWLIDHMTLPELEEELELLKKKYSVFSCSRAAEEHEHPSPLNRMALWGYYANGLRGFCVEYDEDILFSSIQELNSEMILGKSLINYSTDNLLPVVSLKDTLMDSIEGSAKTHAALLNAIRTKASSPWSVENELRFIAESPSKQVAHCKKAIKRLYIGSRMNQADKDRLLSYGRENGVELFEVMHSTQKKTYGYTFRKV